METPPTPPERVRKRVRVRVSDRREKYQEWLRLGLKIIMWAALIVVVAILQYLILKRFGNPPSLD